MSIANLYEFYRNFPLIEISTITYTFSFYKSIDTDDLTQSISIDRIIVAHLQIYSNYYAEIGVEMVVSQSEKG